MTDPQSPHGMVRSTPQPGVGGGVTMSDPSIASVSSDAELAYEAGVELKARGQWSYARMRFFRHKLAVVSLAILLFFGIVATFTDSSGRTRVDPEGEPCDPEYRWHQPINQAQCARPSGTVLPP